MPYIVNMNFILQTSSRIIKSAGIYISIRWSDVPQLTIMCRKKQINGFVLLASLHKSTS